MNKLDIVSINLNPNKGDEVGKIRPCVIISGNEENRILETIIVIPLSTQLLDNMSPYRIRIKKRGKLKYDSDILINQIRTISKNRVNQKIAKLSMVEFKQLKKCLCDNF